VGRGAGRRVRPRPQPTPPAPPPPAPSPPPSRCALCHATHKCLRQGAPGVGAGQAFAPPRWCTACCRPRAGGWRRPPGGACMRLFMFVSMVCVYGLWQSFMGTCAQAAQTPDAPRHLPPPTPRCTPRDVRTRNKSREPAPHQWSPVALGRLTLRRSVVFRVSVQHAV
jgi:hypothetical protein